MLSFFNLRAALRFTSLSSKLSFNSPFSSKFKQSSKAPLTNSIFCSQEPKFVPSFIFLTFQNNEKFLQIQKFHLNVKFLAYLNVLRLYQDC